MKTLALLLGLAMACTAQAQPGCCTKGPMAFHPISGSAYGRENDADIDTAPFLIPEGYLQRIVSSERELNIYDGSDRPDMNTVNETGAHAGRYLYRTHEMRGGAVSVVDLKTGETRKLIGRSYWEALDGIVWTPWHTLLFSEEIGSAKRADPEVPNAASGLVYELKPDRHDPTSVEAVAARPMLGALVHEGIETDAHGNVYVIDEDRNGALYKFVPQQYGDLSSGQLYALKVKDQAKTGAAEWVALDMAQAQVSARVAAKAKMATGYCRPEDIERIGETLYMARTCEDVDDAANAAGPGAILAVKLVDQPAAHYVVAPGKNVPREIRPTQASAGVAGLKNPDNLASGPDGTLWIVEDNEWSDIWVYDPRSDDADGDGYRDSVQLFASLKDKPAEGTGIYFGMDPPTLFVNVQHSGTGNDRTIAITRQRHDR